MDGLGSRRGAVRWIARIHTAVSDQAKTSQPKPSPPSTRPNLGKRKMENGEKKNKNKKQGKTRKEKQKIKQGVRWAGGRKNVASLPLVVSGMQAHIRAAGSCMHTRTGRTAAAGLINLCVSEYVRSWRPILWNSADATLSIHSSVRRCLRRPELFAICCCECRRAASAGRPSVIP